MYIYMCIQKEKMSGSHKRKYQRNVNIKLKSGVCYTTTMNSAKYAWQWSIKRREIQRRWLLPAIAQYCRLCNNIAN